MSKIRSFIQNIRFFGCDLNRVIPVQKSSSTMTLRHTLQACTLA